MTLRGEPPVFEAQRDDDVLTLNYFAAASPNNFPCAICTVYRSVSAPPTVSCLGSSLFSHAEVVLQVGTHV